MAASISLSSLMVVGDRCFMKHHMCCCRREDVNLALWVVVLFIINIIMLMVLLSSGEPHVLVLPSPFMCYR